MVDAVVGLLNGGWLVGRGLYGRYLTASSCRSQKHFIEAMCRRHHAETMRSVAAYAVWSCGQWAGAVMVKEKKGSESHSNKQRVQKQFRCTA
jgi:hypothetical protein